MFKFNQLSSQSKIKATFEYIRGWEETHDVDDLNYDNAFLILKEDKDNLYDVNGKRIGVGND